MIAYGLSDQLQDQQFIVARAIEELPNRIIEILKCRFMLETIYLSFVAACVSFTISETRRFQPLRNFLDDKSAFLGKLVNCGYCFGHWVAFLLVAIYRPRLFGSSFPLMDYFFTALVIAWLSGLEWIGLCYLMKIAEK